MRFWAHYKVYIGHTDAGGIVYHANHLNFLEFCRRDWLDDLGVSGYFLADGGHFVVQRANLRYKSPLLLNDALLVSVDAIDLGGASLTLSQSIYRNADRKARVKAALGDKSHDALQDGGWILATCAQIRLAYVKKTDNALAARPLPQAVRACLGAPL